MSPDPTTPLPHRAPVCTIAWHADPERIGERILLDREVVVSRTEPTFPGGAIADPHLSRKGFELTVRGRRIEITPNPSGSPVYVNGVLSQEPSTHHLDDGAVLLEIAGRVVLAVHTGLAERPPDLELVGSGLDAVRRQVLQAADLDVPVLVRGESGTGKERVAKAVHEHSSRADGPFVPTNVAALAEGISELLGRADEGTLFIDDIGEASDEVQGGLLGVLENGAGRVDVRVIAATDADLEGAVEAGSFREPLLQGLAAFEVWLPPLRERREDVGPLLHYFLQAELQTLGDGGHLELSAPAAEPWFPVELASRLLRAPWPGNVRQLRNAVRQLVIASRGHDTVVRTAAIERLLAEPNRRRPAPDVPDDAAMRAALRAADFRPTAAAAALGISPTTMSAWMKRTPGIREARDLTLEQLEEAAAAVGADPREMARHLEVSARGLERRASELGWPT